MSPECCRRGTEIYLPRPDALLIIAVDEMHGAVGRVGARRLFILRPIVLRVREPAGEREVHAHSGRKRGLFDRAKHGLWKRFFEEREPADPNHQHVGFADPQARPKARPRIRPIRERRECAAVDAER
jgi:hypothetical protein